MANVQIPERYSHDKLRDRLQLVESISLLIEEAIVKEDFEAVRRLWIKHDAACTEFRRAFEEHDVEMQFVDELVEDKKQKDRTIKQMEQKEAEQKKADEKVVRLRNIILLAVSAISLLGMLGINLIK